jgi:hypothetical protein
MPTNVAYTLSKVIDDQSGSPIGTNFTPTTSTAIDDFNLSLGRGPGGASVWLKRILTPILSNGEPHRVVQFVSKAAF